MFRWLRKKLGYSDVLVLGSAHIDTIVDTYHEIIHPTEPGYWRQYGQGTIRNSLGGEGYNIAVNLADPPKRWRNRPLVAIFAYVPSGLELSTIILRRLKIAGVGTRYLRRLRVVPFAGSARAGGNLIPKMGGFVGMRYQQLDDTAGPVDVGRIDSLLSLTALLSTIEERVLSRAISKTRHLVIDAVMAPGNMRTVLALADDYDVHLSITAMEITALTVFMEADLPRPVTLLSVRRRSLEDWAKEHPQHTLGALINRLAPRWSPGNQEKFEENATDGIELCKALKTSNLLVTSDLAFTVFDAMGSVLHFSVPPNEGALNWHGARDAACSALVNMVTMLGKRPSELSGDLANASILRSREYATGKVIGTVSDYVKQCFFTVGATRNSPIDTTETEHPVLEVWYRFRSTLVQWLVVGTIGSFFPMLLKLMSYLDVNVYKALEDALGRFLGS